MSNSRLHHMPVQYLQTVQDQDPDLQIFFLTKQRYLELLYPLFLEKIFRGGINYNNLTKHYKLNVCFGRQQVHYFTLFCNYNVVLYILV